MKIANCRWWRSKFADCFNLGYFLRLISVVVELLRSYTCLSHLTLIRRLVFATLFLLYHLSQHFAV